MANELPFLPASCAAVVVELATTYLLHSTLLLGGTWAVIRVGRLPSEALKERLWKFAAVLPLCTAPLQMILHISPPTLELVRPVPGIQLESRLVDPRSTTSHASLLTNFSDQRLGNAGRLSNDTVTPRIGTAAPESRLAGAGIAGAPVPIETPSEPPSKELHGPGPAAINWIGAVVIGICCVGIVRVLLQSALFARCLKGSQAVREPSVLRMLSDIARRGNVRRGIRLLIAPNFRQPAAFGLFRGTIVLPEEVLRTFEPEELYALLAHESAHLVRGDAVWLWLGRVLCSCLPFQPLNFLARRSWRRSAEVLCDEWAVNHSAHRLALAQCLTRVAESTFGPMRLEAFWTLGATSHLSERVERLVNGGCQSDAWNSRPRGRLVAIGAVALAIVFVRVAPRTRVLAKATDPAAATIAGESAAGEPSQSSGDQDSSIARLGEELRQLKSEIDEVRTLLKAHRPNNFPANDLAARASESASKLQARYQKLVRAARGPAD